MRRQPLAGVTAAANGQTNQQGKDDNLQHIAGAHGRHRIGGENADQHLQQGCDRWRTVAGRGIQVHAAARLQDGGQQQRQADGQRRGGQIQQQGFQAHTA